MTMLRKTEALGKRTSRRTRSVHGVIPSRYAALELPLEKVRAGFERLQPAPLAGRHYKAGGTLSRSTARV